jgi:hypothetical protein
LIGCFLTGLSLCLDWDEFETHGCGFSPEVVDHGFVRKGGIAKAECIR